MANNDRYQQHKDTTVNYDHVFDFDTTNKRENPYQTNVVINNTTSQARHSNSIESVLNTLAIIIIVICMLIWSGSIVTTVSANGGDTGDLVTAIFSQVLFWFVTWVLYYLGWRYYWIMLAIGWLLFTFYALFIINNLPGIQLIVS